ncbi:MAG: hypothetical protein NTX45_18680 [Proteobacteria bacterium]|nr:hypothetical protein [Pseudomonadota bacterium]
MKILFHSFDRPDMYDAKLLLDAKGIPSFIGSESSGPALGFIYANKYTLWVCLDLQYDDAKAVLKNPDHEVKEPVDIIDFQSFFDGSIINVNKFMLDKAMLCIAITLASITGLVYLYLASSN